MDQTVNKRNLQKLDICLFDHFQIRAGNKSLDEIQIRSFMVTKLFVYMICHRNTAVTKQELIDVLWSGEDCENPIGALKNLMYRLRMILKKHLGDYQYILTARGTYQWNNEIEINIDIETFEYLCKQSEAEPDCDKRIEQELSAEVIYQKEMLKQYSDDYWFLTLNEYYHSMYLNLAKRLAVDLEQKERYLEMEKICHTAIRKDGIDEDLHFYLMKAYLHQNKPKMAFEDYKTISNLLYNNIGVGPSGRLQELFEQMMKQQHGSEPDLSCIRNELNSDVNQPVGAFFCEYGVFKKNYELEFRRASRQNKTVFLGLLTVLPLLQYKLDSQAYISTVTQGVSQLKNVLIKCLRAGDVVARYSESQYIFLLPSCSYTDAKRVVNRISKHYDQLKNKAKVQISYSLDEMNCQR